MRKFWLALISTVLTASPAAADQIIHAGRLFDGRDGSVRRTVSIVIRDQRIAEVVPGFITREGDTVIDLSTRTVLPGFVDAHDHLTVAVSGNFSPAQRFYDSNGDATVAAVVNAAREIDEGFTSVRDVGSSSIATPALKRGIAKGQLVGPRVWTALEQLGPTGGHSDLLNGLAPELHIDSSDLFIVDGVDDARRKVREHRRMGADLIKIMPSGGVATIGDDPHAQTMDDDEIKAVVQTAHALGMRVAAHALGKLAIEHAVLAGVDSIEHGTFADDHTRQLMREHGTYLVSTLVVADTLYQAALHTPKMLPPTVAEKTIAVIPTMIANLTKAYKAGVKIALGTDIPAMLPRSKADEFELLVKAGMTPADAILAGTRNAADLIGASADIGTIQAGRYADIVAVDGDPLADITELKRVRFVMKGGKVLKGAGA